ncbi:MAG: TonB-dependent receptor, partial [Bacteroidales bacterium]
NKENPAIRISGHIVDPTGEPIIGANVFIKGQQVGVSTGVSGEYTLQVPEQSTIVVSYLGFMPYEFVAVSEKPQKIILKPNTEELEEVVVVGYGTQLKRDLSGSITSIKPENIKMGLITNAAQILKGRAAGVHVKQNSSEPGGGISIRIRGTGSISSNNEPLYVIDGYPTELGNDINPGDIESMEVLKDAAATAIYGARGANGVILITTKHGREDKFSIDYSYNLTSKTLDNPFKLMNAKEYIRWQYDFATDRQEIPPYTLAQIDACEGEGTDWMDETTRNALTQNHQFAITGGSKKLKMAISANYLTDDGILKNTSFDRFTGRLNLEYNFNEKVRFGSNMFFGRTQKNYQNYGLESAVSNVMYNILTASPLSKPDGGTWIGDPTGPKPRILTQLFDPKIEARTNNMYASIFGEADILRNLSARVQYTYGNSFTKDAQYYPKSTTTGSAVDGQASIHNYSNENQQFDAVLRFHDEFVKKHTLNVIVGTSLYKNTNENSGILATGFTTDELLFNNLGAAKKKESINSAKIQKTAASFFGRLEYKLLNKYILNASMRMDGASNFGKGNKWGYFPSVSGAWQIGEEKFMSFARPCMSSFKLRGSYGLSGNDGIGYYMSKSRFGMVEVFLGGDANVIGSFPINAANPNLKWETTSQMNVGTDITFWNARLEINFDYYIKTTRDLLNPINIESANGFKTILGNDGKIENRGFEIFLKSVNFDKSNFKWITTFNMSQNKNKVLKLNSGESRYYSIMPHGWYNNTEYTVLREGASLSSIYGYVFDGIIQKGETYASQPKSVAGDPKFRDINGDNIINDKDRTIIGNGNPDMIFGMDNSFKIWDFDLSLFIDASYGNELLNVNKLILERGRSKDAMKRWTETNPSNEVPKNGYQKNDNLQYGSFVNTRFVEDASFIRLQNIEIGYTLPTKRMGQFGKVVRNMRVFANAQNLVTFTKYTGFTPEVSTNGQSAVTQGLDFNSYPAYKTFNFGVNISF